MWQRTLKLGTADAYRDYLQHYPDGQFSSIAKLQLAVDSAVRELVMWQRALKLGTADAYRDYLQHYPDGQFSSIAKLQMAAASAGRELAMWQSVEKLGTADAYREYLSHYRDGQFSSIAKMRLGALTCNVCPEMVPIPAGDFVMGSPDREAGRSDNEGPQHTVYIGAFDVSKYPVTRGQWRQYANETGDKITVDCDWLNPNPYDPEFKQDDSHPVVCVNWQETRNYIAWLNKKSGQHFRLLTEAEYEYVNRAGTQMAHFWGDSNEDLPKYANNNRKGTTPVGSFKANPFGLFDTAGNAWEWTQDCWHRNYNGAPTDGSAWVTSCDAPARVLRGGSFLNSERTFRSAYRGNYGIGQWYVGARLARDDRPSKP
jgi:formylglycine-generating enzyme required for sulfatase activity